MDTPVGTVAIAAGSLIPNACTYHGFAAYESAGNDTLVQLYDGENGPLLETISLVAYESTGDFYERGITARTGLFVVLSGSVEGTLRVT